MRWMAAVALGLAAAACGGQSEEDSHHDPTWVEAEAKVDVSHAMRDPGSARVEALTVHAADRLVCGYVNAKNGYGGYAGRRAFIWKDREIAVAEDLSRKERAAFKARWEGECALG